MRLALFNALYPTPLHPKIFGGAEVFVRQLAEKLVEQGHEVMVVRIAVNDERQTEHVNGVHIEFVPVRSLFTPFGQRYGALAHLAWHVVDDWFVAPFEVAKILDAFRPDILHSHTLNGLSAQVWELARDRRIPVVHTLHDYYLVCPRCTRFKNATACARTCQGCKLLTVGRRRRSQLVSAVVGVSQCTLDIHVGAGLFGNAVRHVIRNVAGPHITFVPMTGIGQPLRLGFIGRFSPEKGVRLLLEAVRRLEVGSVRVILAGNIGEAEKAALAAMVPMVDLTFTGFVAPQDFYREVDVLIVPSIWEEPSGLVLHDAQAAGRPAVVTRFGGLPEMVEDGVSGWTVAPDAESLAAVIRQLVERPEVVLDVHHRLKALHLRTLDDMAAEYLEIYRDQVRTLA